MRAFKKTNERDDLINSELHKSRLAELISTVSKSDIERVALFYIISGNDELYQKRNAIYDFQEQAIRLDFQKRADFSYGQKLLVLLGFNIYNGYISDDDSFSPMDCIRTLTADNFQLAIDAICLRRGINRKEG